MNARTPRLVPLPAPERLNDLLSRLAAFDYDGRVAEPAIAFGRQPDGYRETATTIELLRNLGEARTLIEEAAEAVVITAGTQPRPRRLSGRRAAALLHMNHNVTIRWVRDSPEWARLVARGDA